MREPPPFSPRVSAVGYSRVLCRLLRLCTTPLNRLPFSVNDATPSRHSLPPQCATPRLPRSPPPRSHFLRLDRSLNPAPLQIQCPSAQKTIICAAYLNTGYPLAPARSPHLRRCTLTSPRASPRGATLNTNPLPLRTTPLTRSPLLFSVGAFSPHVRSNQRPPPATPPPLLHPLISCPHLRRT